MRTVFKWVAWLLVGLVALGLIIGIGIVLFLGGNTPKEPESKPTQSASVTPSPSPSQSPRPTPSPSPSPSSTITECSTWRMQELPASNPNNRWLEDGLASIRNAKTEDEAEAAAIEFTEKTKVYPELLAGNAQFFIDKTVDPSTLVDAKGCATQAARDLNYQLLLSMTYAEITPEDAPSDGVNSGVDNGQVVVNPERGITGDRSAIKVKLKNGNEVWILARCANPVTRTPPPNLPPGKTDEPPKKQPPATKPPVSKPPTSKPPATTPPKLTPKDPSVMKDPPPQHTPAPAPAPSQAETKAPSSPTVRDDRTGQQKPAKPANPTVAPSAPAPSVPAPSATTVAPKPTPAPTISQAPPPDDPGGNVGDPGDIPPPPP